MVTHNLALVYTDLGLARRARRLLLQAADIYRRTGAIGSLFVDAVGAGGAVAEAGELRASRAYVDEAIALAETVRDVQSAAYRPLGYGRLALAEKDYALTIAKLAEASDILSGHDADALQVSALTLLARAHLGAGDAAGALAATERATAIHRAHDLAEVEGMDREELWWVHARGARGERQGRRVAACARHRIPVRRRADRQRLRRGAAAQLPRQGRVEARDRRGVGRAGAQARGPRRSFASLISRARRACASRSSAWPTPACA